MGILVKPYKISVWDESYRDGELTEYCLGTIGANDLTSPNRAINPILTRNINGTKKFSFSMYKRYIDTITGEETENPFVDWLVNERRVRLEYDGKTYDFIIKDISENSSNYLYTYQLEDLYVQELSKNGFNVTLDANSMKNVGTAGELASLVLQDTDWTVDSSALVDRVEEDLVYVKIPSGTLVYRIADQEGDSTDGISVSDSATQLTEEWKVLAFYSSCTSKPHRFQFIYIEAPDGVEDAYRDEKGKTVSTDENRVINVANCQYYCEIATPEAVGSYIQCEDYTQFWLPAGFDLANSDSAPLDDNYDTTISSWYRGSRYVFAQEGQYVPLLDRYCNKYKINDVEYYGYIDNEYYSPTLLKNMITNTEFKNTTGWHGTYRITAPNAEAKGVSIETEYGHFINNKFSSVAEELSNGTYDPEYNDSNTETEKYYPYLKVVVPAKGDAYNPILINSGIYDNRFSIDSFEYEEEWYFKPTIYCEDGGALEQGDFTEHFTPTICEAKLDPSTGAYTLGDSWTQSDIAEIEDDELESGAYIIRFKGQGTPDIKVSKTELQKKHLKFVLISNRTSESTYYIKNMQLFKLIRNADNAIIKPGDLNTDGITKTSYYFYPADGIENCTNKETLPCTIVDSTQLDYDTYIPQYVQGAQKIRSITAKESNYFNILQNIAETFDAWMELDITKDSENKLIKKVKFKNYIGKNNYAPFRYGVNLKDITRTFGSKNIVTKLIVKNNSNEHAQHKSCSISRAHSNPTGENYIYDFRYFHDRGMLDPKEYVASLYYAKNPLQGEEATTAQGPDLGNDTCNLQNYFNRIKKLNVDINEANQDLIALESDLSELNAEFAIQEGLRDAASRGLEETKEKFYGLTQLQPDAFALDNFGKITCEEIVSNDLNAGNWAEGAIITATHLSGQPLNKWKFVITLNSEYADKKLAGRDFYFQPTFKLYLKYGDAAPVAKRTPTIKCTINEEGSGATVEEYSLTIVDTTLSNIRDLLEQYAVYLDQYNKAKELAGYQGETSWVPGSLEKAIEKKRDEVAALESTILTKKGHKETLNKEFYKHYSRFIQEGTWISEEHIDDDKYYGDAQSVMYSSCTPQVSYTINVLSLGGLEGYEYFTYDIGDKTYVIDPEFFGDKLQEQVIVNEMSNNLDNPSQDTINVQNFKNEFQDLFQKITATVQQAQYSTGAYEKAVALAEANTKVKGAFLQDALNAAGEKFTLAGQTSVEQSNYGITLTDKDTQDQLRLIGGAILMSVQDEATGNRVWKIGLTPDGISASLVTAGTIDTGNINIKNGNDATFMWNACGLTAFDTDWTNGMVTGVPKSDKFIRFDKYGIYGINNSTVNGTTWVPENIEQIETNATFALTWKGLKVTGEGGTALLGRQTGDNNNYIMIVKNNKEDDTFRIKASGDVEVKGYIEAEKGYIGGKNGWEIDTDKIVSRGESEDTSVMLYAGKDDSYLVPSVLEGESSYIRILSGAKNFSKTLTNDVTFKTAPGENSSWSMALDDHCIYEFDYFPKSLQHHGETTLTGQQVILKGGAMLDTGEHLYSGSVTYTYSQASLPNWLPENVTKKVNITFSTIHKALGLIIIPDFYAVDYSTPGKITIRFYYTANSIADVYSANYDITFAYECEEPINIEPSHQNDTLTYTLTSPISDESKEVTITTTVESPCFMVLQDGSVYANAVDIKGTISAANGNIGGWTIRESSLSTGTFAEEGGAYLFASGGYSNADKYFNNDDTEALWKFALGSNFGVTIDGELYASNANISGNITAGSGWIGEKSSGLAIRPSGVSSNYFSLEQGGLTLKSTGQILIRDEGNSTPYLKLGKDKVDDIFGSQNEIDSIVMISTSEYPLIIRNDQGGGIAFPNTSETTTTTSYYLVYMYLSNNGRYIHFEYKKNQDTPTNEDFYAFCFLRFVRDGYQNSDIYVQLKIPSNADNGMCTLVQYSGASYIGNFSNSGNTLIVPTSNYKHIDLYNIVNEWGGGVSGHVGAIPPTQNETLVGGYSHINHASLNNSLYSLGNFVPATTGLYLGTDEKAWQKAYLSDTQHSSDKKLKYEIQEIAPEFSSQMIAGLSPKSYKFTSSKTPRTRYGFIAQEVEQLLLSLGTSCDEVGLIDKSKPGEEDSENNYYSLNYTCLIAPMVSVIQQQEARIASLETEIQNLKSQ